MLYEVITLQGLLLARLRIPGQPAVFDRLPLQPQIGEGALAVFVQLQIQPPRGEQREAARVERRLGRSFEKLVRVGDAALDRITSYNVCYTKLLR